MDPIEQNEEINLWEYIELLRKRKWLIIIPTFILVLIVGIYSFLQTPVWEIDAVLQPSKFVTQTQDGKFEEILVSDPKQIAGEINQASYNSIIAAETNIDLPKMPKIQAENLRDTKLVRIWVRDPDIEKGKRILDILFAKLQSELDKKVDIELKGIVSKIDSLNIQKDKINQEFISNENKLRISEDRFQNIIAEMKTVKKRIDDIDQQLKKAIDEQKQSIDAIAMLLYSNETQNNLRYYNTLDESLRAEKVNQETLRLDNKTKNGNLKEIDTQINLLHEKKGRIDYSRWVKVPTSSINPVAPKKKTNVLVAGICGLFFFGFLAFFLEYAEKNKKKIAPK